MLQGKCVSTSRSYLYPIRLALRFEGKDLVVQSAQGWLRLFEQ